MSVRERIQALLAPPVFEDEEQARLAGLLNAIALASLGLLFLIGISVPLTVLNPVPAIVSCGLGSVIQVAVLFLLRRQQIRLASALLCFALWALITVISALLGGFNSPIISGYGIVILVTGLLLGGRMGVFFAGLSIAGVAGIFYLETNPLWPWIPLEVTPGSALIAQIAILGATALLLYLATRNLSDALERAHRSEHAQRMEAALRESEERIRTIVEGTQAFLVSVDINGRFTYANDAAAKSLGSSPEELIGKPYLHFVHPEDRKRILAVYFNQTQTRRQTTVEEFRIIDTQGNVKWFSFLANLLIKDDQVIGQTGVAQDITERKQAEQELHRRANELAALYETTRDLTTQQDLPTLLRSIVERAAGLVAAPGGAIYLYDAARGDLQVTLATDPIVPIGTRIELGEGMAGRVAQTRQPLIVNDYPTWPHRAPQYEGVPFGAVIEVPMLYGGELVGVLAVEETRGKTREFTDADARLLSLFAGQAASAVRNARLFQEIKIRVEQLAALNKLGRSLTAHLDLDQVLDETYREVSHLLATDDFFVALYNAEKDEIVFPVATRDGQLVKPDTVRPGGQGITGYIIRNQTPVLVNGDLDVWQGCCKVATDAAQ
jgi:PAS domain S-box-containing protein